MTPWAGTSAALVALFTDLSKDVTRDATGFTAEWREGAQLQQSDSQGFKLALKVSSVRGVGNDETRYAFDAGTGTMSSYQYCLRSFTLQVMATSTSLVDGRNPMAVLERVRTRIRRPSSQEALAAIEVALVDCGQALDITGGFDNRRRPAATMDVILQGAFTDDDPVSPGWIQYVEVGSTYDGSMDSPVVGDDWVPEEPPP